MGKSLSVLIEEKRDLKNDLKSLRRNRLYLQERIEECVKGINIIDQKIKRFDDPVPMPDVEEDVPEEEIPEEEVGSDEEDIPEDEEEEEEKPKRKYTPRKKAEEEEE